MKFFNIQVPSLRWFDQKTLLVLSLNWLCLQYSNSYLMDWLVVLNYLSLHINVINVLTWHYSDPAQESASIVVESLADAVTHARFVGTDSGSDEVVLMKILHVSGSTKIHFWLLINHSLVVPGLETVGSSSCWGPSLKWKCLWNHAKLFPNLFRNAT